jgi:cytoskeletal protein RodZ
LTGFNPFLIIHRKLEMLELGTSFRKSRESLNLSIDKIAAETRINPRFLEAIENERFDLLPGGIFNRGFIRSYAVRLGLDPEEAIQGYEKLFRAVEAEPVQQETERVRGKTTKIPVYYVALAGLLILVVVFYFLSRHNEPPLTAAKPAVSDSPAVAPPAPAPAEIPAPETIPAAVLASVPTPEPPPAKPATAQASSPSITPSNTLSNSPSNAAVVIELEVREESWFKLSSDGTDVVSSEVLAPGTTRRYTAANSMNVSIGNAAGVALRVNGQPVSSLGRTGQVRNITITPKTSAASLEVR